MDHREIQLAKYVQRVIEDQTSSNHPNSESSRAAKIGNHAKHIEGNLRSRQLVMLASPDQSNNLPRKVSKEGAIEEVNFVTDDAHVEPQ